MTSCIIVVLFLLERSAASINIHHHHLIFLGILVQEIEIVKYLTIHLCLSNVLTFAVNMDLLAVSREPKVEEPTGQVSGFLSGLLPLMCSWSNSYIT